MAENGDATVDMTEHEKTYTGFIHLTVLTTAFCIAVVIMLGVGGVGGAWGLAGLGIFLSVIAAIVGFLMNGSALPTAAVTAGILVLKLLLG